MDAAAYKILNEVYALLAKKEDKITEKEMSYVIGQLRSLITFYSDVEGEVIEQKRNFLDKFRTS